MCGFRKRSNQALLVANTVATELVKDPITAMDAHAKTLPKNLEATACYL